MELLTETSCRICLKSVSEHESFEAAKIGKTTCAQAMKELFNVKVNFVRGLPSKICQECKAELDAAVKFRDLVLSSHNRIGQWEAKIKKTFSISSAASTDESALEQSEEEEEPIETADESNLYKCHQCSETFNVKADLKLHMCRSHIQASDFKCNICGQVFKQPSRLRTHKEIHKRRLTCSYAGCERSFKAKFSLDVHHRSHTNERNYACTRCDKAFLTGSALKRHIKMHNDQRDYACDLCGKGFRQAYHVRSHVKAVHPGYVVDDLLIQKS